MSTAAVPSGATLTLGESTIRVEAVAEAAAGPSAALDSFRGLVGKSGAMRELYALLERLAPTELSVCVHGPTGSGKELVARAIHDGSARAKGPFVVLDCAALPESLADSELFGHEKGAFTGADTARPGVFELADGGTLFLDEIGDLPLDIQPKLLRVLETGQTRRLGSNDRAAFWFAAGACLLRGDCVVVAHDVPTLALSPGASLVRRSSRRRTILAHRLIAPVVENAGLSFR